MENEPDDKDVTIKIVTIGESGVGKTSIVSRYVMNEFKEITSPTVGVDFSSKVLNTNESIVNLQIWDTAGQERMRAMASAYYREANGVILVFDITNRLSFDRIPFWIKEIRENGDNRLKIVVIGNKSDLNDRRQITLEEAKAFAAEKGYFYFETSAKENEGDVISKAFQELVKITLEFIQPDELLEIKKNNALRLSLNNHIGSLKKEKPKLILQTSRKNCC